METSTSLSRHTCWNTATQSLNCRSRKELTIRSTVAEIDLSAITNNVRQILEHVKPSRVMAVVKANAYGHGAIPVAKTLIREGVDYLAVAIPEEGITLREAGIKTPILVFLSPLSQDWDAFFTYDLACTISSLDHAETASRIAQSKGHPLTCHINVDTGMGRLGIDFRSAIALIQHIIHFPEIRIEGIYTHFSTALRENEIQTTKQLERFRHVLDKLKQAGIEIPLRHAAGSTNAIDLPEAVFNMVRPGLILYGYHPDSETANQIDLKPSMSLKTQVSFLKSLPCGSSIGYGCTYITKEETTIAVLPVGYADGFSRRLSNRGQVWIRGKAYPIIGVVCMDMIMIDVGQKPTVQVGDQAVLFGSDGMSLSDYCQSLEMIPYEVICGITNRVPRVYTGFTDKEVKEMNTWIQ